MKELTNIQFNPDSMTVSDMKKCVKALEGILDQFDIQLDGTDWSPEQAEEFALRVLQVREYYTTPRQREMG